MSLSLRGSRRTTTPANRVYSRQFRLTALEERTTPAIFTVDNVGDSGLGTLRQAIIDANAAPGADSVAFAIPGAAPYTISLVSELEEITESLSIDASVAGVPTVELDGSVTGANGIRIKGADGVTIRGLVINRFGNDGIQIYGGSKNVTIAGNYIGTDLTGSVDLGQNSSGVAIFDNLGSASNVNIGGPNSTDRNIISGNGGQGVYIGGGAGTTGVSLLNNFIGSDITGKLDVGNGQRGIMVDNDVQGVTIGGSSLAQLNLISGNDNAGIYMQGGNTKNNIIRFNIIGADITGTAALANGFRGIWLNNGTQLNTIQGNVIGANLSDGVIGENGAAKNTLIGNQIGFNQAAGIAFINAPANIIGGPNVSDRNYIAGNRDGLFIDGSSFGTIVRNNYIGTDPSGVTKIGQTEQGIEVAGSSRVEIIGNLIVGSGQQGIEVRDGSDLVKIQGNVIGLDASGAVYANGSGLRVRTGSEGALIGGPNVADRNIVSGNKGDAITVSDVNAPAFQVSQWLVSDGGNGHFYVITPSSLWADAENAAVKAGGHLVSIGDALENEFVRVTFAAPNGSIWIGLTDDTAFGGTEFGNTAGMGNVGEGWVWSDGTPAPYPGNFAIWNGGEPNNFGAGENYAEMTGGGGGWNDNGNISRRTVIEFNTAPDLGLLGSSFNLTSVVQNNYVGVDATGTKAVPNTGNGINVDGYNGGQVGGVTVTGNVVSANTGAGVRVNNVGGQVGVFQWTTGVGANNNFYVIGPSTSWRNAESTAVAFGGHLVSITSAEEQAFVQGTVLPFAAGVGAWIGYTDADEFSTEGTYVWSSGEVSAYTSWNAGEPNNVNNEDFAELTPGGGWNDIGVNANDRSIFEFTVLPDLTALISSLGLKTSVTNNLIGTNAAGTATLGNGVGISLISSAAVTVTGNTVAGSTGNGVQLSRSGVATVQGNFIGTDATGILNLANGNNGVSIQEGTANTIGSNFDGKNDATEGNLIRNNGKAGITLPPPQLPTVQWTTGTGANNHYYVFIPFNSTFTAAEANAVLAGGHLVSIGDADEQTFVNNFRGSQTGGSVWIGFTDDIAFGGTEFGNTSGLPNRGEGWVWTDGTPAPYAIGGPLTGYMNWNGGEPNDAGGENYAEMNGGWNDLPNANRVSIFEFVGVPDYISLSTNYPSIPSSRNSLRGNSIVGNGTIGIDLGSDGATANDVGDADAGPNDLLNFPVISSAKAGATTTVSGTYNGLANTKLNVELYASASGSQGARYLGTLQITTDGTGNSPFSSNTLGTTAAGEIITATASNLAGSTSEFSAGVPAAAAANPPTATVKVNGGAIQRSMVTSFTVTFSEAVNFVGSAAAAIGLQRLGTSTIPAPAGAVTLDISPATGPASVFTITFNDPIFASGPAKSLIDGKYTLTLNANLITSAANGQFLDGNGDATAGDNQTVNTSRIFGDNDGDGDTDNSDFVVFRASLGAGPSSVFDIEGDGDVDNSDFAAFRLRFGQFA